MNVIINFKSYLDKNQILDIIKQLELDSFSDEHQFFLSLPFSVLKEHSENLQSENVHCGSNIFCNICKGSFTEKVASRMLVEAGAEFVLLGTSHQRETVGDSNETILEQCIQSYQNSINPFLCLGESVEQHQKGDVERVITEQVKDVFDALSNKKDLAFTLIYDSQWLQKSQLRPDPKEIESTFKIVKKTLESLFENAEERKFDLVFPFNPNFSTEVNRSLLKNTKGDGVYLEVRSEKLLPEYVQFLKTLQTK